MLTAVEINGSILPSTYLCEQRVVIGIVKVDKGSFGILGWAGAGVYGGGDCGKSGSGGCGRLTSTAEARRVASDDGSLRLWWHVCVFVRRVGERRRRPE
jgi:hypothetical protein